MRFLGQNGRGCCWQILLEGKNAREVFLRDVGNALFVVDPEARRGARAFLDQENGRDVGIVQICRGKLANPNTQLFRDNNETSFNHPKRIWSRFQQELRRRRGGQRLKMRLRLACKE